MQMPRRLYWTVCGMSDYHEQTAEPVQRPVSRAEHAKHERLESRLIQGLHHAHVRAVRVGDVVRVIRFKPVEKERTAAVRPGRLHHAVQ